MISALKKPLNMSNCLKLINVRRKIFERRKNIEKNMINHELNHAYFNYKIYVIKENQ